MTTSWWVGLSRQAFRLRLAEEEHRLRREGEKIPGVDFAWSADSGSWRTQNRHAWLARTGEQSEEDVQCHEP